jgi:large subunit ribosomal protein L30
MAARAAAAVATRAAAAVPLPHKLHLVRLLGSPIRKPETVRKTLIALKLRRKDQTVIHKNTSSINGQLRKVMHLVDVQPITFRPDLKPKPGQPFLTDAGVILGHTEESFLQAMASQPTTNSS